MALKTLADYARRAQSHRTKSKPEINRGVLLLAEDDEDSYLLFKLAWECAEIAVPLWRVADGEEAIKYLRESGTSQGANFILSLSCGAGYQDAETRWF